MVSLSMGAAMMGTMYFLWAICAQHGGGANGGGLICVSRQSYRALVLRGKYVGIFCMVLGYKLGVLHLQFVIEFVLFLFRRTGSVRPTVGPVKPRDRHSHALLRHKRKPPRGMFINHDDLIAMASGPSGQGEQMLRSMDREIVSLKRQVKLSRQLLSLEPMRLRALNAEKVLLPCQ